MNKNIERKLKKHTKIQSLALSKHDTIRNLVSIALENDKVTDTEFAQISREIHKYHLIKEYLRAESDKKHIATADTSTQNSMLNKYEKKFEKNLETIGKSNTRIDFKFEKKNMKFALSLIKNS